MVVKLLPFKYEEMRSSEFHRKIRKEGWRFIRACGSHIVYEKNGRTYPVPYHGTKEMGEGLRKKISK
jgi:mRNA interferase HicA